jgi:hypothetical protein
LVAALIDREIRADRVVDRTPRESAAAVVLGPELEGWVDAVVHQFCIDMADLGPDEIDVAAISLRKLIAQWSSGKWPVGEILARLSSIDAACAAVVKRAFP